MSDRPLLMRGIPIVIEIFSYLYYNLLFFLLKIV